MEKIFIKIYAYNKMRNRTRYISRNRTRYRMRRSIQTQTDDTHHYLIENNFTQNNSFIIFETVKNKMFTKYYPGPLNNKEVKLQITYEFIKKTTFLNQSEEFLHFSIFLTRKCSTERLKPLIYRGHGPQAQVARF